MPTRLICSFIAVVLFYSIGAAAVQANSHDVPALHGQQTFKQKNVQLHVRMAEAPSEEQAFDIAKDLGTIIGWEAYLKQHPSGYRADIARGYIDKLRNSSGSRQPSGNTDTTAAPSNQSPQGTTPRVAPSVEVVNARAFSVGKWPERMVFDGQNIWVSESGQRQVAKINPYNGQVLGRYSAGRLPVNLLALPNGQVMSLAHTTNQIWYTDNQATQLNPGVIVPKCPDGMAFDNNLLWVLSKPSCSGDGVTVLSLLRPGATSVEPYNANIAAGGQDIAASNGIIYVAHQLQNQSSFVTAIQPAGGRSNVITVNNSGLFRIVANQQAAYGSGRGASQNGGLVVRVSGVEGRVTNRFDTAEFVQSITATPDYVIAVSPQGTVWVLTADNLTLVRQFRIGNMAVNAHDVLVVDNTLYITSFDDNGTDNNSNRIVVVDGWLGAGRVAPTTARIQRPTGQQNSQPIVGGGTSNVVRVSCTNGYLRRGRCKCRKGRYRVKLGANRYTCRRVKKKKKKRNLDRLCREWYGRCDREHNASCIKYDANGCDSR